MRILYFHQYFITPAGSGGVRSFEFSRRWVQAGHNVHVVTGASFDPSLPPNGETIADGIRVTSVGVPYNAQMGFVERIKSYLHYAMKSVLIATKAGKYDVILATSTPLTVALPAIVSKWFGARKVIFEVRDVWPDAAIDAGVLNNPILIAMARLLEKLAYVHADLIVPLSDGMLKRIADKGVSKNKMTMIPNCADTALFRPDLNGQKLRKMETAEGKFIVLYAGTINLANDTEYLIAVAEFLKNESDIEFWMVGEGNRYSAFQEEVKARGLSNVKLFGWQPKHMVPYFAAAADVGLVTFIHQPVFYENSPNKFFDYISAGLPVLFNRTTWLERWLSAYDCGVICDPFNPITMADQITKLRENPDIREQMGRQSRRLAEDIFSRDLLAKKYMQMMKA